MRFLQAMLFSTVFALAACAPGDETGPAEVRWDKDVCERCVMAVSDRHFSAQVRGAPAGQRTKVYFFDDLGCAVIWLDQQEWKDDPRTEMWVNDFHTGEWIDAFKANYVPGQITPMDYELGAQKEAGEGTLDYAAAVEHIYEREASGQRTPGAHKHDMGHG